MGDRSGQWLAGVINGLHLLVGVVNGWQEWTMGGRSGEWVACLSKGGQWAAGVVNGLHLLVGVVNG